MVQHYLIVSAPQEITNFQGSCDAKKSRLGKLLAKHSNMHAIKLFWFSAEGEDPPVNWKEVWQARVESVMENHPDWMPVGVMSDRDGSTWERQHLRNNTDLDFHAHQWQWFLNGGD